MLSCIRSRENALVFFLELFTIAAAQKLTPEQYAIYKQEFLQKQKINTLQIKNIVEKNNNSTIPPKYSI
jgi:5'(3')-deoxyribonucleotidase